MASGVDVRVEGGEGLLSKSRSSVYVGVVERRVECRCAGGVSQAVAVTVTGYMQRVV